MPMYALKADSLGLVVLSDIHHQFEKGSPHKKRIDIFDDNLENIYSATLDWSEIYGGINFEEGKGFCFLGLSRVT